MYIVVYVTKRDFPLITFDAIEVKSMDKGLVSVNDLEKGISQDGHIAVYGIHFESGKSDLMPESADALKNIATYINNHPDKKYLVVGHTDNVGDFNANLKLSNDRANAVMNELVTKYSVNGDQLKAFGDGSTAPVVSNSTEGGKAKNRRVEIVEQ
jgi:OmpA-OmpF porin, OOP family